MRVVDELKSGKTVEEAKIHLKPRNPIPLRCPRKNEKEREMKKE